MLQVDICGLNMQINNLNADIKSLSRQSERQRELFCQRLGTGRQIYEAVATGGTMKNISIADEECFVDYFSFAHPERFAKLVADYSALPLRQITYLILVELGYSDQDIQRILFVKGSTVRNYRSRANKRRKAS